MSKKFISRLAVILCVSITAILGGRNFLAYAILNFAQVNRLHGIYMKEPYALALRLASENFQMRWQAGEAFFEANDVKAAVDVFIPFVNEQLQPVQGQIAIAALVNNNQDQAALRIFNQMYSPADLPSAVASRLLNLYFQGQPVASQSHLESLLSSTFGLDSNLPEFETIRKQVIASSSDESTMRQSMREALQASIVDSTPTATESAHSRFNDESIIADLLENYSYIVHLGSNLIENGDFETQDPKRLEPSHWNSTFMNSGNPWNLGLFVTAIDRKEAFSGSHSIKIEGIYVEQKPNREPARAGYWHDGIDWLPSSTYLISFAYRTNSVSNTSDASIWLTDKPIGLLSNDYHLPSTKGLWCEVHIIVWNQSSQLTNIRPLLRSFSTGTVWFDDFSIREIRRVDGQPIPPRDPIIDIRPVSAP